MQQSFQSKQQIMQRTSQEITSAIQTMHASMLEMELQMGQMATELSTREHGRFPSQQEINPLGHEHVKAITTRRSGKVNDNQVAQSKKSVTKEVHNKNDQEHDNIQARNKQKDNKETVFMKSIHWEKFKEPVPFPQFIASPKQDH